MIELLQAFQTHHLLYRYLTSSLGPPNCNPFRCHATIAFACLAYFVTSFDLISGYITELEKIVRVAKGFHSLHNYADAYWSKHLIASASGDTSALPAGELRYILDHFIELELRHFKVRSTRSASGPEEDQYLESLPKPLRDHECAARLLCSLTLFRDKLQQENCETGEGVSNISPRTTITPSAQSLDYGYLNFNTYK